MARLARVVVPHIPHHITQRGNRRQRTFFNRADYQEYLRSMKSACRRFNVDIWAYCLMPNHVHLVLVPETTNALAKAVGTAHEAYTRYINFKKHWRGYLWQGRFSSFPMDEKYLQNTVRYIELNPMWAKLCDTPEAYPWSSAASHLFNIDDGFTNRLPLLKRVNDWRAYLSLSLSGKEQNRIQRHERTGRPLGSDNFIKQLEKKTGRQLLPKKPGPKKKMGS